MRIQNNKTLNFKSGLNANMRQEIRNCNVGQISNEFQKHGIETNFKGNKTVAWCSLKAFELVKKLRLGFPKGVFLEDFDKLCTARDDLLGLCNFAPTLLYKNNGVVIPANTLFFNQNISWGLIDSIADESYEYGFSPSSFFLEPFIHEFAHSMHENNLLNKFSGVEFLKKVYDSKKEEKIQKFHNKFDFILAKICIYASTDPFEAVACDLSNRIIKNLNKNDLTVNSDFLPNSPYRKEKMFDFKLNEDKLSKTIKNFWNGKFS